MSRLYESINKAHAEYLKNKSYQKKIHDVKNIVSDEQPVPKELQDELRSFLMKDDVHPYLKSETYDILLSLNEIDMRTAAAQKMNEVLGGSRQRMKQHL